MVAAADGAERGIEARAGRCQRRGQFAPGIVERPVEIAEPLFELVEAGLVRIEIGGPERHAAADVVADQRGVKPADREERGTHRIAASGVQVGHAGHMAHAGECCRGLKLLDRVAFDPGVVRGDQGDAVGQVQDAIAHGMSISGSGKTSDVAGRSRGNAKALCATAPVIRSTQARPAEGGNGVTHDVCPPMQVRLIGKRGGY